MVARLVWAAIAKAEWNKTTQKPELSPGYGWTTNQPQEDIPIRLGIVSNQDSHILTILVYNPAGERIAETTESFVPNMSYEEGIGKFAIVGSDFKLDLQLSGMYTFNALLDGIPIVSLGYPIWLK